MSDLATAITALGDATNLAADTNARLSLFLNELVTWAGGTASGGPLNNGTYPFTAPDGAINYEPSPAKLQSVIAQINTGGAPTTFYATRAALYADLAHAAGVIAMVYFDPDPTKSGFYVKSGASGAGAWALTDMLYSATLATVTAAIQPLVNAAAASAASGSASAITAAAAAGAVSVDSYIAAGFYSPQLAFRNGDPGYWYDPSDLSTMFQDIAGTIPAVVDGPVGKILDKSGFGNHGVMSANDGTRPTLRMSKAPDAHSGFYYLDFGDVNALTQQQRIIVPPAASIYSATGAGTCVAAVQCHRQHDNVIYGEGRSTAGSALYNPLKAGGATSSAGYAAVSGYHLASAVRSDGNSNQPMEGVHAANDETPRVIAFRDSARTITTYLDERQQATRTYAGTFTLNTCTIGAATTSAGASAFWAGRLYGIVGVRRALSVSETNALSRWMASKCRRPDEKSALGARTFYNSPQALMVGDKPVVGSVTPEGAAFVTALSGSSSYGGMTSIFAQWGEVDDHDDPAFLVRQSDGRLIAWGSQHNSNAYSVRVSIDPFGTIFPSGVGTSIASALGSTLAYANAVQMTGVSGTPILLFYRAQTTGYANPTWHMVQCDNDGVPSAAPVRIYNTNRGYMRLVRNRAGTKVFFACNDINPTEGTVNNLYAFYLDATDMTFRKMDGTLLTTPFVPSTALPKVWDQAVTGQESWIWEIVEGETDKPVMVFTSSPVADDWYTDHRYNWAKYTGTGPNAGWIVSEVCKAGGGICLSGSAIAINSRSYSGGITVDPLAPNVVYGSRKVGPKFRLSRYETNDDGATWREFVLTSLDQNYYRPQIVRGATAEPRLTAMRGAYQDYQSLADLRTHLLNSVTGAIA